MARPLPPLAQRLAGKPAALKVMLVFQPKVKSPHFRFRQQPNRDTLQYFAFRHRLVKNHAWRIGASRSHVQSLLDKQQGVRLYATPDASAVDQLFL